MKLQTLTVQHVQHFHDLAFDFRGDVNFHVLYGPNEAGKTTLLQIVLDWLFGGTPSLGYTKSSRIMGTVVNAHGRELAFTRTIQRNKLVAAMADATLEQDLQACLQGHDRSRYELLYGLNHERLREGGEGLLSTQGDAATSLFAAGGGIAMLQRHIDTLSQRAGELVGPRNNAITRKFTGAMNLYRQLMREIDEKALRGQDFTRLQQEIEKLRQMRVDGREQERVIERERARLERLKRVRGSLLELAALQEELRSFADMSPLTEEDERALEQILELRVQSAQSLHGLRTRIEQLEEQRKAIVIDKPALRYADEVNALLERVGQYENLLESDLPRLEKEYTEAVRRCDAMLERMTIRLEDGATELLHETLMLDELYEVAELWQRAMQDAERVRGDLHVSTDEVKRREDAWLAFGDVPDIARWQTWLEDALQAGHNRIDTDIQELQQAMCFERRKLEQLLSRQRLVQTDIEHVAKLPIPLEETINQYEKDFSRIDEELRECRRELEKERRRVSDLEDELERLEGFASVPTAEDLQAARAQRDTGWALIKAMITGGVSTEADVARYLDEMGETSLSSAFERAIANADELVDEMLQDAARFADRAAKTLEKEQTLRRIEQRHQCMQSLLETRDQLTKDWVAAWADCGLVPGSPREMKQWLIEFQQPVRDRYATLLEQMAKLEHYEELRQQLRSRLELAAADLQVAIRPEWTIAEWMQEILRKCHDFAALAQQKQAAKQALDEERDRQQNRVQELAVQEQKAAQYAERWQALRAELRLLPETPDVTFVRLLSEWQTQAAQVERLARELQEAKASRHRYEKDVHSILEELSEPVAPGTSYGTVVRRLQARVSQAIEALNRLDSVEQELTKTHEQLRNTESSLQFGLQEMERYSRITGDVTPEACRHVIAKSRRYRHLEEKMRTLQTSVVAVADGVPLEKLQAELAEYPDPDELERALQEHVDSLRDLREQLEHTSDALRECEIQFEEMNRERADAATKRQEAEAKLAEADRYWREYLRVELARRLLQRAIEWFHEQNPSTVLDRSSMFFRRLTCGRYEKIDIAYEVGGSRLVVEDASGKARSVAQLSDGTRDQLYLALRLGFIENHLQFAPGLPLMMDDILVHFDDERTLATLEVLSELSAHTQVFYFTHHQFLVDAAKRMFGHRVVVHHLVEVPEESTV
ncbi:hypothetical protein Heshes_16890 [Alicyclobacillus hesperidum]|uniref:YhaN AAA domain-containing protein n=1 Tax=Alicyclobacillus hesperidum TaxID=89784 RepID=A0AA37TXG1_9BACL|nr:AAA family ATPase [Alicyclobacillus hesperidum]GLV14005.1 hypothetical protein Heshes_16890 [Alicyclobacillus hesperidum]